MRYIKRYPKTFLNILPPIFLSKSKEEGRMNGFDKIGMCMWAKWIRMVG